MSSCPAQLNQAEELLQQHHPDQARALLSEYVSGNSHNERGWFLFAVALYQCNMLQEALATLEQLLNLSPGHPQGCNIKALILVETGKPHEALDVYRLALKLTPNDRSLQLNMAIVLEQNGDVNSALKLYDQLCNTTTPYPAAWLNRGTLFLRLGNKQNALANNRQLAELFPEWEHAHFNLAESLLTLELWSEATVRYTKVLSIEPEMAKAYFGRGLALSMLRKFDEAQFDFDRAKSINPEFFFLSIHNAALISNGELREFNPQVIYFLKEFQSLNQCNWHKRNDVATLLEGMLEAPGHSISTLCERALLFNTFTLDLPFSHRLQLACNISTRIKTKVKAFTPTYGRHKANSHKIKIGYVSPDFRKHPLASLSRRLYALHDRIKFEIYGYSLRPDDGSTLHDDIAQGCDYFREIYKLDDIAAAELIHSDGIDILVDLAGYTDYSRTEIFAMRPAPIQACYLGLAHTTGADFMDYFIADPVVITADTEQYFSEKIAYLPHSYFIFDNQQNIARLNLQRMDFHLPPAGFVFCCHNANYKITPDIFSCWMRILQQVPQGVLWLLKSSQVSCDNLCAAALSHGIDSQRLIFADVAPNDIYLARYQLADLFLDTPHCNAHTTAAEALWAGLPVLTCRGETLASRVGSSLLQAIGLEELITTRLSDYEEKAKFLARHPDQLQLIKQKLSDNRLTFPLFKTEQQVQNIEGLYQKMWSRHHSGLKPENISLNRDIQKHLY